MASIEYIQKRVDGKRKEIEKLEKKLDRINAAKATNWEVNPYWYTEDDIRYTTRNLAEAREALTKWESELTIANEKAASRDVPAITEFLDRWKARVEAMYHEAIEEYPEAYEAYKKELEPLRMDYFKERKLRKESPDEWRAWHTAKTAIEEDFKARFGFIEPYIKRNWSYNDAGEAVDGYDLDWERVEKDLTNEYNRKYDFIIERTNAIVKVITDASGLRVGAKGDLNGVIIGTGGKASVKTIGAGGYNIQCFHFRTLIHRVGK